MSLISLAAPRIRLAAADERHEQELFDALRSDERGLEGFRTFVYSPVERYELAELTSTEWQWYASWRQALGGQLDPVVLDHLTAAASTRFARYEVHKLVLRDPETNQRAPQFREPPPDGPGAIGLKWLSDQAQGARVTEAVLRAFERGIGDVGPDDMLELRRNEALELMRDALQCATEASWFLLRRLTSLDDEVGAVVRRDLGAFVRERDIEPRIWEYWGTIDLPEN
jgi:hypothetical protein